MSLIIVSGKFRAEDLQKCSASAKAYEEAFKKECSDAGPDAKGEKIKEAAERCYVLKHNMNLCRLAMVESREKALSLKEKGQSSYVQCGWFERNKHQHQKLVEFRNALATCAASKIPKLWEKFISSPAAYDERVAVEVRARAEASTKRGSTLDMGIQTYKEVSF